LPLEQHPGTPAADLGLVYDSGDFGRALATGENTMKLIEGFDSNYRYILVAARRARQLQGGAPPVIETHSRKPCRIAQDEIKAGKVKWVIPETPKSTVEVVSEMLDKALGQE
jgi:DNA-directed RNA polymerase subunit omega